MVVPVFANEHKKKASLFSKGFSHQSTWDTASSSNIWYRCVKHETECMMGTSHPYVQVYFSFQLAKQIQEDHSVLSSENGRTLSSTQEIWWYPKLYLQMDIHKCLIWKNMFKYNYVSVNKKLNTLVTGRSAHILRLIFAYSHTNMPWRQ